MKTLIILGALMLISVFAQAQSKHLKIEGNIVTDVKSESKKVVSTVTTFRYVDNNGNEYPIYITSNGRCFVYKTIKTGKNKGKQRKQYLPKETCLEICDKLNMQYK